jgi:hypothetical protein
VQCHTGGEGAAEKLLYWRANTDEYSLIREEAMLKRNGERKKS